MRRKILVTGGAGFVGSFLVDELVKDSYGVTVFDNLNPQVHSNSRVPNYLNKNTEFIKGDVRDYEALKEVMRDTKVVFHLVAAVGGGQSQYQIKKYVDVNIGGTANLLDILVNHKNKEAYEEKNRRFKASPFKRQKPHISKEESYIFDDLTTPALVT
ncbi:MAG: SDR family NAD(P)-dependent oxidoreductase [Candidatus Atribacteria bacterium]